MSWWRAGAPIVLVLGCGNRFVPSPFLSEEAPADAGTPGLVAGDAGGDRAGVPPPSELLGGPCVDDAQCDDGIECTFGSCDLELGRCRFEADDARCADDVYCNGLERCDPRVGCRAGPPISCSDSTSCTVDRCDEATRACVREDRDADGDGDVDGNCQPGGDCNDSNPRVASTAPELCGNQQDDDCDGQIDEEDCQSPEFDTCAEGLAIAGPGSFAISPAGAALDYGAGCSLDSPATREQVLLVEVPEGEPRDIEIVARSALARLALAPAAACGEAPEASVCVRGTGIAGGEGVARLRLHSPPPGLQALYLYTDSGSEIQLEVSDAPATPAPVNVSCDERTPLAPGAPVEVDLAIGGTLSESACPVSRGDRFFEIVLDQPSDVRVIAQSSDGFGEPRVSLRADACATIEDELRCNRRAVATVRARALPAGTYVVAVSATGPTRALLALELLPPSTAPAGDACAGAPPLGVGRTETVSFEDLEDDIEAGCNPGWLDAARQLELAEPSDVLVVARFSSGDFGGVSLTGPACSEEDTLTCTASTDELARVSRRGLPAGSFRVVAESLLGLPATLLAAVRPAAPPTLVPGADACADALSIGPEGGFFQGNTSNATPSYSASCDFATPVGAPDQLLRLVLPEPRRVVLDMQGSDFETLLDVRRGPECPGDEVVGGCAVFSGGDRSFLDLDLPAGEYFVQIDGYAGASGNWFLNVFVLDP